MKKNYVHMDNLKKALVGALLLFCSFTTFAGDITKGFNYQAIARDISGNPMANKNISVELSIRQSVEFGTIVWQETHTVTTNEFGLFTLVIGEGTTTGLGTAQAMKNINWSTGNYFVQVMADFGNGFVDMGSSKLQSVPYAMQADSASASPRYPLTQLPDVDVTNMGTGAVLQWNGTKWAANNITVKTTSDSAYLNDLIKAEASARNNGDQLISARFTASDIALQNITNTVTDIQDQITTKNADINNMKAAMQTLTTTTAALQTQTTTNTTDITDMQTTVDGNTNDITTNTSNIDNLTDITMAVVDTVFKLMQNMKDNTNAITVNSDDISANAVAIYNLTAEVTTATNTVNNISGLVNDNTNTIALHQTSIQDLENLDNGKFYMGSVNNKVTEVTMTGDVTMDNNGVTTIANNSITASKIETGTITLDKLATDNTPTNENFLRGDGKWSTPGVPADLNVSSVTTNITTTNNATVNGMFKANGFANFNDGIDVTNDASIGGAMNVNGYVSTKSGINLSGIEIIKTVETDADNTHFNLNFWHYFNNQVIMVVKNTGSSSTDVQMNDNVFITLNGGETVVLMKTGPGTFVRL